MGIPAADLPPWGFYDRPRVYKTKRWDSTIWLSFDSESLVEGEDRGFFPYRDVINRWVDGAGQFNNVLFHSSIIGAGEVVLIQLGGGKDGIHLLIGRSFMEAIIKESRLHGLNNDDYSANTVHIVEETPVEVVPAWAALEPVEYGTPDELLDMQEIMMLFAEDVDPETFTD